MKFLSICPKTSFHFQSVIKPSTDRASFVLYDYVLVIPGFVKIVLIINLNLLIIANSFLLNIAELDNFSANKYENANKSWHFHIY